MQRLSLSNSAGGRQASTLKQLLIFMETGFVVELAKHTEGLLKGVLAELVCGVPDCLTELHAKYGNHVREEDVSEVVKFLKETDTSREDFDIEGNMKVIERLSMDHRKLKNSIDKYFIPDVMTVDNLEESTDDDDDDFEFDRSACEGQDSERDYDHIISRWNVSLQEANSLSEIPEDLRTELGKRSAISTGSSDLKTLFDVIDALMTDLRNPRSHWTDVKDQLPPAERKQCLAYYEATQMQLLPLIRYSQQTKCRYTSLLQTAKLYDAELTSVESQRLPQPTNYPSLQPSSESPELYFTNQADYQVWSYHRVRSYWPNPRDGDWVRRNMSTCELILQGPNNEPGGEGEQIIYAVTVDNLLLTSEDIVNMKECQESGHSSAIIDKYRNISFTLSAAGANGAEVEIIGRPLISYSDNTDILLLRLTTNNYQKLKYDSLSLHSIAKIPDSRMLDEMAARETFVIAAGRKCMIIRYPILHRSDPSMIQGIFFRIIEGRPFIAGDAGSVLFIKRGNQKTAIGMLCSSMRDAPDVCLACVLSQCISSLQQRYRHLRNLHLMRGRD